MSRRTVRVKLGTWDQGKSSERPGIILRVGAGVVVLTPAESFRVANQLVDAADQMLTDQQEMKKP